MTSDELLHDPSVLNYRTAAERVVQFHEQLALQDLRRLDGLYVPQALFKDPLYEARGIAAIQALWTRRLRLLGTARFAVQRRLVDGAHCFLAWECHFQAPDGARMRCVQGGTLLQFAPDGRVLLQRDHWDQPEVLRDVPPRRRWWQRLPFPPG
ncbi:MAG: nuclear transport factor 2 family protein [Rhodoferax sp.]